MHEGLVCTRGLSGARHTGAARPRPTTQSWTRTVCSQNEGQWAGTGGGEMQTEPGWGEGSHLISTVTRRPREHRRAGPPRRPRKRPRSSTASSLGRASCTQAHQDRPGVVTACVSGTEGARRPRLPCWPRRRSPVPLPGTRVEAGLAAGYPAPRPSPPPPTAHLLSPWASGGS